MKVKRIIYTIIGIISLGLGAVGTVLPFLPTVPFMMLATYCFARSSDKLSAWFKTTKIYKDNLESFVSGRGMTKKTKVQIMVTVTIVMSIGFAAMGNVLAGRLVLCLIWVFHMIYFLFFVKTAPAGGIDTDSKRYKK